MPISLCLGALSYFISSIHFKYLYVIYVTVHNVLFRCVSYVMLGCVLISAKLICPQEQWDQSSQMAWNRAYKSSLPGNNRAHINRALLSNSILIKFWKFLRKAVHRNGCKTKSSYKQPKTILNINMHLSAAEPRVITDDASCVLVDYCSIAHESILLWGFKEYSIE